MTLSITAAISHLRLHQLLLLLVTVGDNARNATEITVDILAVDLIGFAFQLVTQDQGTHDLQEPRAIGYKKHDEYDVVLLLVVVAVVDQHQVDPVE